MGYADNMERVAASSAAKKTTNAFGIGNASKGAPFYIAKPKPIKSAPKPSNNTEIWDVLAARKAAATTKTSTNDGTTYGAKPASTTPTPVQTTPEPEGPVSITTPEPEPAPAPPPPPE